ncbi:Hsp33 family molecular chaperone HslO [Tepidiphilus baoligensis]|uniref:Hsp33 family molecular chaperone HslO n=1 Tax=Tepidiphilus baoligensis TaxID=2698687 RepID=A0ABX1QMZ4_9PROT|nr:Hsp33 family molecular chaperone HslO [Tepidiphilus baoligensis]NMH17373.1 Hsp33 family molecular chaperone HslO [Tepidiphilus baoligensis]
MHDAVQPFLIDNADIRGAHVRLVDAWQGILARRNDPPAVQRLLGELAAFAAMIAARLKDPTRITFQAQGEGPVSLLVVDLGPDRNLRAFARYEPDRAPRPDADARELLGEAQLQMVLDLPVSKEPYVSIVPWNGQTLRDTLEAFLAQSEQQPARLWLAANEHAAAGLLLQKLPSADEKDPDGWNRLTRLADTVTEPELLALDAPELLSRLFPEERVRLFTALGIAHEVKPNEAAVIRMLRLLGRKEVEAQLERDGEILVRDELGGLEYRFTRDDLPRIFTEDDGAAPATRH